MSEIAQALAWITATSRADSALMAAAVGGTWEQSADFGTAAPYELIVHQAGTDVLTMNAKRLFDHLLFQIKMVGPTAQYAALVTGADRIDALFGDVRNRSLSPGYVLSSYREQPFTYGDIVNGAQWSHLGGIYHISLQGS